MKQINIRNSQELAEATIKAMLETKSGKATLIDGNKKVTIEYKVVCK